MTEVIRVLVQQLRLLPLTAATVVAKVGTALLCGIFISWLYRRTYRGPGYSVAYANTLILLAMCTAVMIMVIGNNLARAFGLVGALSVVRFRHAVKNTQDIVYVFFALAVGMAAGVGFYGIAFIATLFIGLIVYLLSRSKFAVPRRNDYLLQLNYKPSGAKEPPYQQILNRHCAKLTPINVRSLGDTETIELSFYVRLKDKNRGQELIAELNQVPEIQFVNLFYDEEQI